jgi:hypothetical protein
MEYSVAGALKAGIKRERILNFMSANDLEAWAASLRETSCDVLASRRGKMKAS